MAFSPDGQLLASSSYDATVRLWSVEAREELAVARGHKKNVSAVVFSPDGQTMVSGGIGGQMLLWSVPDAQSTGTLPGHEVAVGSLALSPDGRYLASMGYDGTVKLWSLQSWELDRSFDLQANALPVSFSADARVIAVGVDYKVLLLSIEEGTVVDELPIGAKGVYAVAFSPDGRWLACGAADKKIRVWRLA